MHDQVNNWQVEDIPGDDNLFYRVHRNSLMEDGSPMPGAFRNTPDKVTDGMSTDWDKYSTADETRNRGAKDQSEYAIVSLCVVDVREIPNQRVVHSPDSINNNRAHTDVFGIKDVESRVKFKAKCKMCIKCG